MSAFLSRSAVGKGSFSSYLSVYSHVHACLGVLVFCVLSAIFCLYLCVCVSILGLYLFTSLSVSLISFCDLNDGDGPLFFVLLLIMLLSFLPFAKKTDFPFWPHQLLPYITSLYSILCQEKKQASAISNLWRPANSTTIPKNNKKSEKLEKARQHYHIRPLFYNWWPSRQVKQHKNNNKK